MASSANIVRGGATVAISGDLGYIKDGITLTPSVEMWFPEGIEQLATPPKAFISARGLEVAFTLMEPTLANIKTAWDITEATSGTSPITLTIGGALTTVLIPQEFAITVTGVEPGGSDVRSVILDKCVITGPAPLVFTKTEESNLAVTATVLYDDVTNDRLGLFSDA